MLNSFSEDISIRRLPQRKFVSTRVLLSSKLNDIIRPAFRFIRRNSCIQSSSSYMIPYSSSFFCPGFALGIKGSPPSLSITVKLASLWNVSASLFDILRRVSRAITEIELGLFSSPDRIFDHNKSSYIPAFFTIRFFTHASIFSRSTREASISFWLNGGMAV